jgi:hypothetical protein
MTSLAWIEGPMAAQDGGTARLPVPGLGHAWWPAVNTAMSVCSLYGEAVGRAWVMSWPLVVAGGFRLSRW